MCAACERISTLLTQLKLKYLSDKTVVVSARRGKMSHFRGISIAKQVSVKQWPKLVENERYGAYGNMHTVVRQGAGLVLKP